jgi:hypothetical protein
LSSATWRPSSGRLGYGPHCTALHVHQDVTGSCVHQAESPFSCCYRSLTTATASCRQTLTSPWRSSGQVSSPTPLLFALVLCLHHKMLPANSELQSAAGSWRKKLFCLRGSALRACCRGCLSVPFRPADESVWHPRQVQLASGTMLLLEYRRKFRRGTSQPLPRRQLA